MAKKLLDVLIVGAGPVGLYCANEVIRQGLTCRIIDKKEALSDKSKALALHIRTLDLFEDCGFLEEIVAKGQKIHGVYLKSNGIELAHMTFAKVEANRHFVIDLPQDQTERVLDAALRKNKCAVEWRTELTSIEQTDQEVTATIKNSKGDDEIIKASWVIACDGGHSTVRQQLKIPFLGSEYKQRWWLADLIVDWEIPEDQMVICPSGQGPLACFPMGNKRYRLVMLAPEDKDSDPTLEDIVEIFNSRTSDPATLSNPIWITKFFLHHRQIQDYRKGRVFFAGDAAHIHSPMGGQGLNTGLQDIYNLVWKMALVHNRLAKDTLLDSYHSERYPVGRSVIQKTDMVTKGVLIKNPLLISLRNLFLSTIMSFQFTKNKFATGMAELDISYAKSPIVTNLGSKTGFKIGKFLVDFSLSDNKEKETLSLHEIIRGTAHHLFLFAGLTSPNLKNLVEIATCISEKYPEIIIPHIVLIQKVPLDCTTKVWLDSDKVVHNEYKINQPTALLMRPDKYVGMVQAPVEKEGLLEYLGLFLN